MRFELGGDGVGVTRLSTGTIAASGQQRVWVRVVADASDGTRNRHDDGIYSWMLQYPVDRRPRVLRVPLNRMQVLITRTPTAYLNMIFLPSDRNTTSTAYTESLRIVNPASSSRRRVPQPSRRTGYAGMKVPNCNCA